MRVAWGLAAVLLVAGACGDGGETREASRLSDEEIAWLDWQGEGDDSVFGVFRQRSATDFSDSVSQPSGDQSGIAAQPSDPTGSSVAPSTSAASAVRNADKSTNAESESASAAASGVSYAAEDSALLSSDDSQASTAASVASSDTEASVNSSPAKSSATAPTAAATTPITTMPPATTTTSTTAATITTTTIPTEVLAGPGALELTWPLPYGEPGELIDIEHLGEFNGDFSGHRILYHSRNKDGEDIAVSGYALVPLSDQPPEGGYPVVAYAHGTTGMADRCAPSEGVEDSLSEFRLNETLVTKTLVGMGYAVVATDYEGLGTPGLHPYLVGKSEANSVLDSVRALRDWGGDRFSDTFVVLGVSQGGHAALHAGQYWRDYAPELDLAGVVAVAPPSQFESIETSYETDLGKTFLMMIFGAYADAYDEVEPSDVLTPRGVELLEELERRCIGSLSDIFAELDVKELQAVDDPLDVPGLREIARENDVNRRALPAPLLIVHGNDDKIVEYYRSQRLCPQIIGLPRQGPTQMVTYINEDHYTISLAAARDMADWIRDRFAGEEMTEVGCDERRDTIVGDVADFFRGARGAYNAVRDFFGNLGRSIGDFFGNLFG